MSKKKVSDDGKKQRKTIRKIKKGFIDIQNEKGVTDPYLPSGY